MAELLSLAGALLAVVGALVVTLVPDASAAGFALTLCGAAVCGAFMRGDTPRTGCAGHNDLRAHDGDHAGAGRVSQ